MEQEEYASAVPLYYPGANLTEEQRQAMDEYRVPLPEVTIEHLVYSLSRQVENNFHTTYAVAEDLFGEERARELAYQIGLRYGGLGYASLLKAAGTEGAGTPRLMALYQDLVHYIRGPKHTSALFAEYDDERCVVKRKRCIYFKDEKPEHGKYVESFERGAQDGYENVDRNLVKTEIRSCLWKGDGGCEQHWIFDGAASASD